MKIIIVLFIAYAVINSSGRNRDDFKSPDAANAHKSELTKIQEAPANLIKNLRGIRVQVLQEGSGSPSVCGQRIVFNYKVTDPDNKVIEASDLAKPVDAKVGFTKLIPALENGLFGRKAGSKFIIESPAFLAYDAAGFTGKAPAATPVNAEVEIIRLEPELPASDMNIRIFDIGSTTSPAIVCGGDALVDVEIWNTEGKKIYPAGIEAKPLKITVGSGLNPYWLEGGVFNLSPGITRTLIVPPTYSTFALTGESEILKLLGISKPQMLIVELKLARS